MTDVEPNAELVARVEERFRQGGRLFIDGGWSDARSGDTFELVDPGTGTSLGRVANAGTDDDVDDAVRAARESFAERRWTSIAPADRGEILWRVAELIERDAAELALTESRDNGMPYPATLAGYIPSAARCFRYYAGMVDKVYGIATDLEFGGAPYQGYTRREPLGVAGLIVPWNGPFLTACWKAAAALAAGCSCVLKPSEDAPTTPTLLGALLIEAGVPAGVFNVVTGLSAAGAALAEHADVDALSFTGSTAVGKAIVRAAAGNLKRLTLELGGKSPVIVMADADIDRAAQVATDAIFWNSGQICTAGSRLLAQRPVAERLVELIAERAKLLRLGYGTDPDVQIGPLISARHRDRVSGFVDDGRRAGVEVVTGGSELEREGFFYRPTVLHGVDPSMSVAQQEIFGPVLSVIAFDDPEEAIAIANDSDFGLAASVFTSDVKVAHGVARRLRAGRVGINIHTATDYRVPFGGYKQSGWGREHGPQGMDAFLETKSVVTEVADF